MLIYINHLFEYVCLINEMVSANKCSLEIDYKKFIYVYPNIAIWMADAPHFVLEVMENVAKSVVFQLHPNYKHIHQKICVLLSSFPLDEKLTVAFYVYCSMIDKYYNLLDFCD
ncbi:unnamed protein product [Vicia faba]|uniref:MCM N-terminal domain-containing protein n=1 Tax=Vicia faba TaxID=3906 RepID=A0AAV1B9I5_VICFA|nr:unnamed protein product [Vicia faba]